MRALFIGAGRILRPAGISELNLPQVRCLPHKVRRTLRGFRRSVFPAKQAGAQRRVTGETSVIIAFAALSLALIAVPCPGWAYIIAAGVRGRVVGPAVGGLMLGYVVITVVVVLGLGPIAANAPILLVALTIGGAGYLIYLVEIGRAHV